MQFYILMIPTDYTSTVHISFSWHFSQSENFHISPSRWKRNVTTAALTVLLAFWSKNLKFLPWREF